MDTSRLKKLAGMLTEGRGLSTPKKGRIPTVSIQVPKYMFFLNGDNADGDLMKQLGYASFNESSFRKAAIAAGIDEHILGYAFGPNGMVVYHQKGDMGEAIELMKKFVRTEDDLYKIAFAIV